MIASLYAEAWQTTFKIILKMNSSEVSFWISHFECEEEEDSSIEEPHQKKRTSITSNNLIVTIVELNSLNCNSINALSIRTIQKPTESFRKRSLTDAFAACLIPVPEFQVT